MRRLLTGYARELQQAASPPRHLFQNRYKSILCEEERYLRQLVAYIHLNPLRAGVLRIGGIESLSLHGVTAP